jgi:hypothetical protein
MSNHEYRQILARGAEITHHLGLSIVVERTGSLVEYKNFSLLIESTGDAEPLTLSAR